MRWGRGNRRRLDGGGCFKAKLLDGFDEGLGQT